MKSILRRLIVGSPLEPLVRSVLGLGKPEPVPFRSTAQYWEDRYAKNGDSGAGSYGRLADFKADVVNDFVSRNNVASVIEFGCGDGNQLSLSDYGQYIGIDISESSIERCRARFEKDKTKRFEHISDYQGERAELSLSLDVIYHLVEDETFERYMKNLFDSAERYVIAYSCDTVDPSIRAAHVEPRKFTEWVSSNRPDFELIERIPNRYPYDPQAPDQTSSADFYVYERRR